MLARILLTSPDEWARLAEETDRRYSEGLDGDSLEADEKRLDMARTALARLVAEKALADDVMSAALDTAIAEMRETIDTLGPKVEAAKERLATRDAVKVDDR